MKVKYIRESDISLTKGKIYEVLAIEPDFIELLMIPRKIIYFILKNSKSLKSST